MSRLLPKFSKLKLRQQQACRMRAEGITIEATAAEVGVTTQTVEQWFCPSGRFYDCLVEYKAFMAKEGVERAREFQDKRERDAGVLWERLKEMALAKVGEYPAGVILGALDSALDRAGVERVSKTEGKHTLAVSDEDRRKRFEEIANLQADLAPLQLKRLGG